MILYSKKDECLGLILMLSLGIFALLGYLLLIERPLVASAKVSAAAEGKPLRFHFWDTDVDGSVDQIVFTILNKNRREWMLVGEKPYGLQILHNGSPVGIRQVSLSGGKSSPYAYVQVDLDEAVLNASSGETLLEIVYKPETGDSTCSKSCIKNSGLHELQSFHIKMKLSKHDDLQIA